MKLTVWLFWIYKENFVLLERKVGLIPLPILMSFFRQFRESSLPDLIYHSLILKLLHAAMPTSLGSSPEPKFEYCLTHKMKCGRVENHELPLSKLSVAIPSVEKELHESIFGAERLFIGWNLD